MQQISQLDSKVLESQMIDLRDEYKQNSTKILQMYGKMLSMVGKLKKDESESCVFLACQFGDIDTLKRCLEQLDSKETISILGLTEDVFINNHKYSSLNPLSVAIYGHHLKICHYLILQQKMEITKEILLNGVKSNHTQIFSFLLENSKLDHDNLTMLLNCIYTKGFAAPVHMLKILLTAGAEPSFSLFSLSIVAKRTETFKLFLESKPNININRLGSIDHCLPNVGAGTVTLLQLAAMVNRWDYGKLLLDKGIPANVNVCSPGQMPAMHWFASHDNSDVELDKYDVYLMNKECCFNLQEFYNIYVISIAEIGGWKLNYYCKKGGYDTSHCLISNHDSKVFAAKLDYAKFDFSKPLKDQVSIKIFDQFRELIESYKENLMPRQVHSHCDNSEAILTLLECNAIIDIDFKPTVFSPAVYFDARKKIFLVKGQKEIVDKLLDIGIFGKNNSFIGGLKLIARYAVEYKPGPPVTPSIS